MKISDCPFGCGALYGDPLQSEADAYWFGTHQMVCSAIERESNG